MKKTNQYNVQVPFAVTNDHSENSFLLKSEITLQTQQTRVGPKM